MKVPRFMAMAAALILVLAACGDDDDGADHAPDATPPPAVHDVTFDLGPNHADAIVFSSEPDGAVHASLRADAEGVARLEVVEGGSLSFVDPLGLNSIADLGADEALTWRGWRDGPAFAGPFVANLSTRDGAETYDVYACNGRGWSADAAPGSVDVFVDPECTEGDPVPFVAFATGSSVLLGFATAETAPATALDPGAALGAWSDAWEDVAIDAAPPPEADLWGGLALRLGRTRFQVPHQPATDSLRRPPGAAEVIGLSLQAYTDEGSTSYFGPPRSIADTDWLAVARPASLTGVDRPTPSLVWRPTGEGDAIAVQAYFEDGDGAFTFVWHAIAGTATSRVTVPELPAEARIELGLDAAAPVAILVAFVNVVDFDDAERTDLLALLAAGRLDLFALNEDPADPRLAAGHARRTSTVVIQP